ncbi:MAG: hypothetical protein QXT73_00705 [Candidatus Methanomethylicaceae archaeon]
MQTKHFTVKIEKRLVGGEICITMGVRQQGGALAYIFVEDPSGDGYRLREDTFWSGGGPMGKLLSALSSRRFKTAAEAARWIEEVRQFLLRLDAVCDERLREIEALPD